MQKDLIQRNEENPHVISKYIDQSWLQENLGFRKIIVIELFYKII
jgi:hypothetical protein